MADGVGGMAVDGGSPRLTLSSLAVLAFHGGGAGAGVPGARDGGDTLTGPTATRLVTALAIPAMGMAIRAMGMAIRAMATGTTVTATATPTAPTAPTLAITASA